ncbi:MAG: hypothetical protein ACRCXC_09030 [Legionella sp.]
MVFLQSVAHAHMDSYRHEISRNKGRWFYMTARSALHQTLDRIADEVVHDWLSDEADRTHFFNYQRQLKE